MPTLDMRSTATASSRVNVELTVDDHARDIGLELDERFGLGQLIVPAVRAARRQRNIVGLVDLLRHRSAMVLAMILAALASRLLRIGFAFLAKRCCLAFAFAFHLLKSRREQLDLLDQPVDDRLLLLKQRLAIGTVGGDLGHIHAPQILVESPQIHQDQFSLG